MDDKIIESIALLNIWLEKNGWAGYDPYDIKGNHKYLVLYRCLSGSRSPILKALKMGFDNSEVFCPMLIRKIFDIQKEINAKALGLFARSYIDLYNNTQDEKYREKARYVLDLLAKHSSKGYSGMCWGYPFDWQSLHFLPRGTPSGVVSACVGDAFFRGYQIFGDKKYLDTCQSICNFFMNDLNIDFIDEDKLCFSYTPVDKEHVHNVNLFVAEFLFRIGKEIDNKKYIMYGMKALNYTLNEQNSDGSFYYFGTEDKIQYNLPEETLKRIDHYHTGFVLRSLYSIYTITEDEELFLKFRKCYRHYCHNLFEDKTIPKFTPEDKYPINIHSCAEAILCMSILHDIFPDALEYAHNVFLWTKNNMQTKDGWFIYMIVDIKGIKWKVKIPYIRWGQAWMLRALSQYYFSLHKNEEGKFETNYC